MVTEFETKLLGLMMMVIMLGMGASLTWRDFLIAFRKPKGVLVGMLCQYGVMPFLGFSLAMLLGLPPAVTLGLILMACMPGGTTSNVFTYFSKGVLALSILMTSVSTLVALLMVPLLLEFYSSAAGLPSEFKIPAANVAQVLLVLLVPTLIGMVLRKANPNIGASLELVGSVMGVVVIAFLILTWVPRNHQLLADTVWPVYFAAIGLGLFGIALGYLLARLLRQDSNRSRTIGLETGIQNGPLAILIVTLSVGGAMQQEVLLVPVLYSVFIVISSCVVMLFFRRLADREALVRDQLKAGTLLTR
ncbi:bile acid:sodium symporter family protein [Hydrogenophaga sp.]|uniref:bile acid:sodium symporter family protein n=1 Tax=Hydrogenophaga sp. TaxID=1904254 RepID=UPI00198C451E|nr:bile acid:sodium symporter family protein [Hydrogenophaga sp.]MBD3892663.1 transporter [Hydrogenophaga sp.]